MRDVPLAETMTREALSSDDVNVSKGKQSHWEHEGIGKPALGNSDFLGQSTRRELLDRLARMSRVAQGISLNTVLDFDAVLLLGR